MSNVYELEKQLVEAKAKQKLEQENKEMQDLIDTYVGKCYGTRTFRQKSKATYNSAIYIEKISREKESCYSDNSIICVYHQIYQHCNINYVDKNIKDIQYSRGRYSTKLNETDYNMFYHMSNLVERKKEIPKETFDVLYNAGEDINIIINKAFEGKTALTIEKTIGDSGRQESRLEMMQKLGIEFIDLEEYPKLLNAIRYAYLPGFEEDRYFLKDYAKKSLQYQIQILKDNINDSWTDARRASYIENEIKTIQEHINILNL